MDIDIEPELHLQNVQHTVYYTLVRTIEDRLLESSISLSPNTESFVDVVAGNNADLGDYQSLLQVARCSASCTNNEVQRALGLVHLQDQAEEQHHLPPNDHVYYYVRSIELSKDEFERVIHRYSNEFSDSIYIENLREHLINHPWRNDTIYLRYGGCTSHTTPLQRLHEDTLPGASPTRFSNFYRSLHHVLPDKQFQVFLVPNLSIQGRLEDYDTRYQVDGREQILIHFLGRSTLLNSQPGGYYRYYQPLNDDIQSIQPLRDAQNLRNAEQYLFNEQGPVQPPDNAHVQQLQEIYNTGYRIQLLQEVPYYGGLITNDHVTFFGNQAYPKTQRPVRGGDVTPIIIFAKDITRTDFALLRSFFDGSRSGAITKDLITEVFHFQQQVIPQFTPPAFHDLWPCRPRSRQRGDLPQSLIHTSGRIMQNLRAALIITLGFSPASVGFSNFQGCYSLGVNEYSTSLGIPQIIDYDYQYDAGRQDQQGPRFKSIMIPHLHPGFVSYGSADPRILRLMFLCWCRTLILLDIIIELLNIQRPGVPEPGTTEFCQQVLNTWEQRESVTDLPNRINEARAAVINLTSSLATERSLSRLSRSELYGQPPPGPGAYVSLEYGRASMASKRERYGLAAGRPNSQERISQRLRLERARYPELRRLPSFVNGLDEWRIFFDNLREDTVIFNAILARIGVENIVPLAGLTRGQTRILTTRCQPPVGWTGGNEWMNDPEMAMAAFSQFMEDLRSRIPAVSPNELRRRGGLGLLARFGHLFIDFFIRKPVRCDRNGKVHLQVFLDDFVQHRAEPEGIFVGVQYQGNRMIDLDPDICDHALVLKNEDNTIARPANNPNEEAKLIYDWWLLLHSRDGYFACFRRTVQELGLNLRNYIQQEVDRPLAQQFSWRNIINRFLTTSCPVLNTNYMFLTQRRFASRRTRTHRYGYQVSLRVIYTEISTFVNNDAQLANTTEFERIIWNMYLQEANLRTQLTRIFKSNEQAVGFTLRTERTGSTVNPQTGTQYSIHQWTFRRTR
ncbi:hypothetical protein INT45_004480 [Circinella minor]|uniref:Uncharacterized protein n=1 Tax=Circinella minor TaxID=1195481 RepID=A0A8H7S184_9FUNG|nr:hypothetical protein INT45_004480 [Circinella minor]